MPSGHTPGAPGNHAQRLSVLHCGQRRMPPEQLARALAGAIERLLVTALLAALRKQI